jgi:hypothetical protein
MRGAGRIQHIVGDLLDLSRERERADISVHATVTDLCTLCQQIVVSCVECVTPCAGLAVSPIAIWGVRGRRDVPCQHKPAGQLVSQAIASPSSMNTRNGRFRRWATCSVTPVLVP